MVYAKWIAEWWSTRLYFKIPKGNVYWCKFADCSWSMFGEGRSDAVSVSLTLSQIFEVQ